MNAGVPASVKKLRRHCSGVTLVELLVVISIMGILSGIGVAGLRSAVANARIKDAAFNIASFMERTANDARRLSTTLCVLRMDAQKLVTYVGECATVKGAANKNDLTKTDSLILDTPNKILQDGEVTAVEALGDVNLVTDGAEFKPRQGLSAAPAKGFIAVQYGGDGRYGAAAKTNMRNSFFPMMKFDEGNWFKL